MSADFTEGWGISEYYIGKMRLVGVIFMGMRFHVLAEMMRE